MLNLSIETMIPITLSHCVVVRTFLMLSTCGSSATGSDTGGGSDCLRSFFATMLCASIRAFSAPRGLVSFSERQVCPQRHVLDFFVSWREFVKSLVDQQVVAS